MTWLTKHPEVVYSEMEDGAVLLHLESRFYYSLDEAGLEIWRSIDTARHVEDLRAALLAKFDARDEEATARIREFVAQLEHERLVLPGEPSAALAQGAEHVAAHGARRPLTGPALLKHDEPLHEMSQNQFDPQLPLAE